MATVLAYGEFQWKATGLKHDSGANCRLAPPSGGSSTSTFTEVTMQGAEEQNPLICRRKGKKFGSELKFSTKALRFILIKKTVFDQNLI